MINSKRLLTTFIIVMLMFLVGQIVFAGAQQEEKGEGTVTLRFAWWGGDDRHIATLVAIDEYMMENPNIIIEAEYQGWDGYKDKLMMQLASGTAPEVFQNHWTWIDDIASRGDLIEDMYLLKEYINQDIYSQGFLDSFVVASGKMLAAPITSNANLLAINKKLFKQAGIDINKEMTWEDAFDANLKLKAINPDYYFLTVSNEFDLFINYYVTQISGKPFATAPDYKLNWSVEEITKGYTLIKRYLDEGVVQPLGDSSLFTGHIWDNPKYIDGEFAADMQMISTLSGVVSVIGEDTDVIRPFIAKDALEPYHRIEAGQVFSISKIDDENKKIEAAKFVNWLINSKEAGLELGLSRGIPISNVQKQVLADAGLISPLALKAENFVKEMKGGTGNNVLMRGSKIRETVMDISAKLAFNILTPEETAAEFVERITELLDEMK